MSKLQYIEAIELSELIPYAIGFSMAYDLPIHMKCTFLYRVGWHIAGVFSRTPTTTEAARFGFRRIHTAIETSNSVGCSNNDNDSRDHILQF